MTDQPKKTTSSFDDLRLKAGKTEKSSLSHLRYLLSNVHTLLPLLAGVLLILSGLVLVSITILGFITPLWISAILSLLGSASTMVGVFLIYHTVTAQGALDSLINKAIRRVVDDQN